MAYELLMHLRTQLEIENAIEWYFQKGKKAPAHFIHSLE